MWLQRILWVVIDMMIPFSAFAEDHQYQFTQIINKDALFTSGIIIDQRTGDMWEYTDAPGNGQFPEINGVRYLGKLQTGQAGESIIGNYGKPKK